MSERDDRKQEILEALRVIQDPDLGRDIVSLGFVKDVTHCDGAVKVTIELTTPACPVKDRMKAEAEVALKGLAWVTDVNVKMTAQVRSSGGEKGTGLAEVKNIIAIGSGKGGVGKSTVAVNLAAGLSSFGAKVGLLDADIYGPSIPTMLGASGQPAVAKDAAGRQQLQPVEAQGLRLMSIGFLVEPDKPVIWRGPMLHQALRQFFGDVNWGPLDYLIVDLPPGTGDVALSMVQTINLTGAVIVSTPQEVAMVDARKALSMFEETGVPVLGIVENMSGEIFGKGGAEAWALQKKIRFLGSLPLDARVRVGGDAGRPAVLDGDEDLRRPFIACVEQLAAAVSTVNAAEPPRSPISIEV